MHEPIKGATKKDKSWISWISSEFSSGGTLEVLTILTQFLHILLGLPNVAYVSKD